MTTQKLWEQAENDKFAANLDGVGYQARLVYGTKISRDNHTGEVELFNVAVNGDYYQKLTEKEANTFLAGGWRYGVYVLSLSNNRTRLDSIEKSIRREVNGEARESTLRNLRTRRQTIVEKYNKMNLLLNQLQ